MSGSGVSSGRDVLERIAAALERLGPPVATPTDWLSHPAYIWDGKTARALTAIETVGLERLRGINRQKALVADNIARLAMRAEAHDMLLWGARGMGKSALIRAGVAAIQAQHPERLALVQLSHGSIGGFADLVEQLAGQERAFLLFQDDLGFAEGETQDMLGLRSLLDGGVMARPANVRLAVTSNRRAIVERDTAQNDPLHDRDERDNALALADRFGLAAGFHPCDREAYLEILSAYTAPAGLTFTEEDAMAWAIARGNLSGRTAYQFACELAGRAGIAL